jgi:hypothetical protein
MAHYILISIEDDETAKTFVIQTLVNRGVIMELEQTTPEDPIVDTTRAAVCGVWRAPTQFCDPSDGHRGSGKFAVSYTRGKKYGWWVCTKCGKPSQAKISACEWEPTLGTNLLPAEFTPEPFKKRMRSWRSPIEWTWLFEKLGVPQRTRVTKTGIYEWPGDEPLGSTEAKNHS